MDDSLAALVGAILRSPRVKSRLVVLCEGDVLQVGDGSPPSPQMYGRLEQMPDANFYKACVPRDWQNHKLPQFFTCGGRSQVLGTFQALLEEHDRAPERSYLTPEMLYAIVDLDIQTDPLPHNYPFRTTEDIHAALYEDGAVKADIDDIHRLWVTALVHKEAFFVLPGAAASWATGLWPHFEGAPLDLRALHTVIAQQLAIDLDVAGHLDVVRARLARFRAGARLSCQDAADLSNCWLAAAGGTRDEDYEPLVKALLAVAKVKPLWSKITPAPGHGTAIPAETYRDQLALNVARSIGDQAPDAHPLAGFFAWLKPRR